MNAGHSHGNVHKLSLIGVIVTLGIVYGDIGTSPLYVMKAIVSFGRDKGLVNFDYITGALSCIIWTLTLQTTFKYVIVTLRADNRGEGGILALYALLKKKKTSMIYMVAIVGACALIADGIITPSITVTSAIEGLNAFHPGVPVIEIVIGILIALFVIQQFGTHTIGKFYGPIMLVWFLVLGVLGAVQISHYPQIVAALNPMYALRLLIEVPQGFLLLGAVFLCTTGAEALYSDLGHCGIQNIRVSWVFVKITLILNYLGQGAWILSSQNYSTNPFFGIMPSWFLFFGIIISTAAAIIASQALISGLFTLFNEAMSLNFWPRQRISHPSNIKGQLYISFVNWFLMFSCIIIVLIFQSSSAMEAAYGLSITITMIMTTILLLHYMRSINRKLILIIGFAVLFLSIELSFFIANMFKFFEGGILTVALAGVFVMVMYVWYNGRKIKNKYIQFFKIKDYSELIQDMKDDTTIPKYANNLVFISKADYSSDIESKILYSIINKHPKRADHYWILHMHFVDEPFTNQYTFEEIIPGTLFRIEFRVGFRMQPQLNLYFRRVISDLIASKELSLKSSYPSLNKHGIDGDFKFIIIHRIHNSDQGFSLKDKFVMNFYTFITHLGISDIRAYGLDTSNVQIEMVPLVINQKYENHMKRVDNDDYIPDSNNLERI